MAMQDFLDKWHLPRLNEEESTQSNSEISAEEIWRAITSLKSSKAPVLDGFPGELYKKSNDMLNLGVLWSGFLGPIRIADCRISIADTDTDTDHTASIWTWSLLLLYSNNYQLKLFLTLYIKHY